MNRMSAESGEAGIYIVDQNYRIIYLNDMARSYYPNLKAGMHCYEAGEGSAPCPCPGKDSGHMIYYNTSSELWMDVSSGEIEWPGYDRCRLIMFRPVSEKNKNLFYYLTDNTVYDELLELNISANTYRMLSFQKDKYILPEMDGGLDLLVARSSDSLIHPEDREAFLKFWDSFTVLERLHANGRILRGEFRKKLVNGSYGWVCMIFVLFRCGECEDAIIMCYVQDISGRKAEEEEEQRKFREKREETDFMTGLFRYGPFFEKAEQMLKRKAGTVHFMVAIDIEHFKFFNEWYGEEEGDRFLIKIGNHLKEMEQAYDTVAGYMGGDDFVVILPADSSLLDSLEEGLNGYVREYGGNAGFRPAFGIYLIEDLSLPVSMMYDRASIALNSIKGKYTQRIGWFDPGMKQKMQNDQVLLSEIQRALEKKEFIFHVQPQCDMLTGRIVGLESLVRWQHPVRGLVFPGDFIPLLEQNGFITYLDVYIWEMVCQLLNRWKREGRRLIPISVNVSRMDIRAIDIVSKFRELVDQYKINPKFLEIEITESAYAEDYDLLRNAVENLRKAGFPVFMDDFGSGYSSLNMLKDVNVDVIKIDTKFLDMNENSRTRGMGILETIVRMARVMQLKVIAEGVEQKSQVDFLINTGCIYGQGYYYYKPMDVEEAEQLLLKDHYVDYGGIRARQTQLKLEDLFNENITSEVMMNNLLGAIALYEVYDDLCEVLWANEEYYRITGDNFMETEERKRFILNKIYKDDADRMLNLFELAYKDPVSGAEGVLRRCRLDGSLMWVQLRVFFLREQDGRRLYYGSVRDFTEQVEQRRRLEDSQKILTGIVKMTGENISLEDIAREGYKAVSNIFTQVIPGGLLGIYCEKGFPLYFANKEVLRLLEYDSYEVFAEDIEGKVGNILHPEDMKVIQENISRFSSPGMEYTLQHRLRKRDGSWLWLKTRGRVLRVENGRTVIINSCMDITDTVKR